MPLKFHVLGLLGDIFLWRADSRKQRRVLRFIKKCAVQDISRVFFVATVINLSETSKRFCTYYLIQRRFITVKRM